MENPCKDCQKRSILCHSGCKDYLDWTAEEQEKKQKIRTQKEEANSFIDYKTNALKRNHRWYSKGA